MVKSSGAWSLQHQEVTECFKGAAPPGLNAGTFRVSASALITQKLRSDDWLYCWRRSISLPWETLVLPLQWALDHYPFVLWRVSRSVLQHLADSETRWGSNTPQFNLLLLSLFMCRFFQTGSGEGSSGLHVPVYPVLAPWCKPSAYSFHRVHMFISSYIHPSFIFMKSLLTVDSDSVTPTSSRVSLICLDLPLQLVPEVFRAFRCCWTGWWTPDSWFGLLKFSMSLWWVYFVCSFFQV